MNSRYAELARSFEARNVDTSAFRHSDHVAVAYEILRRYDFIEATIKYAENLKAIATKAGRPARKRSVQQ